jgi:hypothetical protein
MKQDKQQALELHRGKKNAVFWDIKTQFVPHKKHMFLLQSLAG